MFHEGMAVAVLVNGKVTNDKGNRVYLPFNTEYALRLKNVKSSRAVVSISIDGEDVLGGDSLVVPGNSSVDLERFVENHEKGHRFKFIKMTEAIAKHRGRKVDDGVVVIKWQYEKPLYVAPTVTWTDWTYQDNSKVTWPKINPWTVYCSTASLETKDTCKSQSSKHATFNADSSLTSNGITSRGSISNQAFSSTWVSCLEDEVHEISFQIMGERSGEKVVEVTPSRVRTVCDICGSKNPSNNKFCGNCGTNLENLK